jgi:hypothetical protein
MMRNKSPTSDVGTEDKTSQGYGSITRAVAKPKAKLWVALLSHQTTTNTPPRPI